MRKNLARVCVAAGTTVALLGALVGQASAHITVDSLGTATQGGFAKIAVSVPNERDDASTVKVSLSMPKDHPMPFVSAAPKPGWEITTTRRTLDTPLEMFGSTYESVVDTVTWTALEGTEIAPGQFDQFWLSVGALPTDAGQIEFPAIQTYSSGEEVAWIEPTPASGEEPEHPVPTLMLVAGSNESDGHMTGGADDGADRSDSSDDGVDTLSVVALVAGLLGLGLGGAAFATRKRSTTAPSA